MHKNVDAKDGTGHFFYDTFVNHHLPGFMRAVTDGPGAEAAEVMGADKTNRFSTNCWSRNRAPRPRPCGTMI